MRRVTFFAVAAVVAAAAILPAQAELQNVEVGGALSITGWYYNYDSIPTCSYIDEWTRLHVKADFTNEVSAFIEFDSYDVWGEDFRSNYLTGVDGRAVSNDDVEMYQAYIEAQNLWGAPLTLRVGRQELMFGSEWLVGNNSSGSPVFGLSFDAIRLTYAQETFTIDAVAAKLNETFQDFGKGDGDFYILYGSYTGLEDHTFDAYWMYLRDDAALTPFETDLHTFGLRAAGEIGAFDYEVEAAYQLGGVDGMPSACPEGFGEADVDYDTFGMAASAGYTLEVAWSPRPYLSFAYLGGGDPDNSIWSNDRTLPFNRLFSDTDYTSFLAFTDLSNVTYYGGGVDLAPTETVALNLDLSYLRVNETAPAAGWTTWCKDKDHGIGWEASFTAEYQYSEDLSFSFTYVHLFGEGGLEGNYVIGNGLIPWLGDEDDDYDAMYLGTSIEF